MHGAKNICKLCHDHAKYYPGILRRQVNIYFFLFNVLAMYYEYVIRKDSYYSIDVISYQLRSCKVSFWPLCGLCVIIMKYSGAQFTNW